MDLPEPNASSTFSIAALKLALAFGLPSGLATIVVMLWIQPKSPREWAMALICTVVSSVCGGAWAIEHYQLHHLAAGGMVGLMAIGGVIFACGLPGWVVVRALFAWMDKHRAQDLAQLLESARNDARSILAGRSKSD